MFAPTSFSPELCLDNDLNNCDLIHVNCRGRTDLGLSRPALSARHLVSAPLQLRSPAHKAAGVFDVVRSGLTSAVYPT